MSQNEDWFDDDIAAMSLSYGEKSGLQLYRNYTKSFENHAIGQFREGLTREKIDLDNFKRLSFILSKEDIRFTPVIACGYADEVLKSTFIKALPNDVPGGARDMLSGFGPLSDLSKRIKMAFAFDVLSRDLMNELDLVRKVRNRVSHDWDMKAAEDLLRHPNLTGMYPIELMLEESGDAIELIPEVSFRIRLIWLMGRLTYEGAAYSRAKLARLNPSRALYEDGGTTWLSAVSTICMNATRNIRK